MPDDVAFLSPDLTVDEGAGTVSIELVRTGDLIGPVEVFYNVTGTTATAGADFVGDAGSVVIPAGETTGFIDIPILDDDLVEDADPVAPGAQPEVFGVSIETVAGGEVGIPRTTNVFITDDESDAATPPPSPTEAAYVATEEVVAPLLGNPMSLQWLPTDPTLMLIAQKNGVIKVFDTATDTYLDDFVDLSAEVNDVADRGLIDFVFHPDFADVPKVYMTYSVDPPGTAESGGAAGPDGGGNRFVWLVSFDVDLTGASPTVDPASKQILVGGAGQTLDDIAGGGALDYTSSEFVDVEAYPASDIDPATGEYKQDYWKIDSASHVGGGLAFGPDGALYVGVGDGTSFNYADERTRHVQDVDALAGKILRIDPLTGEGLPDNPFYTGDPDENASKVWQSGLRNPLQLAFDDDGELFISNTGWFSWEEIESGGPGANFGWPLYEGGDQGALVEAPEYAAQPDLAPYYAEVDSGERVITPAYRGFSHTPGVSTVELDAIVGASGVYQGDVYPADVQGDYLFIDATRGDAVYAVDTDDPDSLRKLFDLPQDTVAPGVPRLPVGIVEGPDGYLYFPDLLQGFVGRWLLEPAGGEPTPSPVPPAALLELEAEDAVLGGDSISIGDDHGFFSGTGYVDFGTVESVPGSGVDFVEWTVAVEEGGLYDLYFRYANGFTAGDQSLTVEIDGEPVEALAFAPTAGPDLVPGSGWAIWRAQFLSDPVELAAGTHTITLRSDGRDGPNVDLLAIDPATATAPTPPAVITGLQAETAILGGDTIAVGDIHPFFTGTGYADFGGEGDFVEWTLDVEAEDAGTYELGIRYANGFETDLGPLLLEVDGEVVDTLDFPPTGEVLVPPPATAGNWSVWYNKFATDTVELDAGTHTVRLLSEGGDGPNVDRLVLRPAMEPAPVPADTTVRLQAEDAFFAGGTAIVGDEQLGFRGTGYVDFGDAATDFVKWTVDVAADGVYDLGFRYANGLATRQTMTLEVDGEEVETLAFRPTADWATWRRSDASEGIALTAGTHTIRLESDGDDGPNVDLLVMTPDPDAEPPVAPPAVITGLQAETAILGGDTIAVGDIHPFFTGTGYADFGGEGDFVEWTLDVDAEDAGTYELGIRYANGFETDLGPLLLEVDGEVVDTLDFPPTGEVLVPPPATAGNWSVWYNKFATDTVELDAGTHTVRLLSEGGDGPNVDRLVLEEAMAPAPVSTAAATRLEAEDAFVAGGTARVGDEQPGFSGTGYADFGEAATDFVKWTVDVAEAGLYELAFGYANGFAAEESMSLQVDDTFVERLDFATTGTWTDWAEQAGSAAIELAAGTHSIRLESDGDDGPNVDYLALEFVDTPV